MILRKGHHNLSDIWNNFKIMRMSLGILSAVLLIMVWFAAYNNGTYQKELLQGKTTSLNNGWVDKNGNTLTLPAKLPYQPIGYSFSQTIQSSEIEQQSLLYSAKYLNVHIFLDDKELGSCLSRPNGENKTLGKSFTMLPLPDNLDGQTLRIEAEPLLGVDVQYEISAPRIGPSGLIVHDIIHNELPLLIVIAAIFCFGIFLLICSIQTLFVSDSIKKSHTYNANFLQIGLFAILFAFYSLSITDTIYLFLDNPYFIYLMEFLILAMLPMPLLAQTAAVCQPKYAILLKIYCWILCLNVYVQTWLHFFAGAELRANVLITHILMVISVILIVLALTLCSRKGKGRWWPLLSFSPILIGALMDIFQFYQPGAYQKAVVFQLGVLVFLLLQTAYLIRLNLAYYENHLKSNVYRQMAYTDALTGLANRTAFEEKLAIVKSNQENFSSIWCISADINNLKQVNDTFGHAMGDELIKGAATTLLSASLNLCEIYRTGGDEFVLLSFDQSKQEIMAIKRRFNSMVEQYNQTHKFQLSIALGFDRFGFAGEDTIDELISRADSLMYQNKRIQKQALNTSL